MVVKTDIKSKTVKTNKQTKRNTLASKMAKYGMLSVSTLQCKKTADYQESCS